MKEKYLAVLVGLLALSVTATALGGTSRSASGSYNTVQGEANDGPGVEGGFSNSVTFSPKKGERTISVTVKDKSGLPTRALVVQEQQQGWGPSYSLKEEICGRTKAPIRFKPRIDVKVIVQDGPCSDGTAAAMTFGTVEATFSR